MVPNFFHLRMTEATVLLGTFNAAEMFWYPSPDLCFGQFLRPRGLVFALTSIEFQIKCIYKALFYIS